MSKFNNSKNKKFFTKPLDNTPGGVLAGIWRKIVEKGGHDKAMGHYIDKFMSTVSGVDENGNKTEKVNASMLRKTRSSLTNYIHAPTMTWKTLNVLLFELLKVKKVELYMKVTHTNGKSVDISVPITPIRNEDEGSPEDIIGSDKTNGKKRKK